MSALSQEELVLICNRQAELLKHVREVIMCFNPKHYFVEQETLISKGEDSYWSELMGLRRIRDSHEKTIGESQTEISKLRTEIYRLNSELEKSKGRHP